MTPHGPDPASQTQFRAKATAESAATENPAPASAPSSVTTFRVQERIMPGPRPGWRWNWRRAATHPVFTWGLALIGVSIIGWSLLFRLPDEESIRPVYASSGMSRLPELGQNRTALNEESIERLRQEVQAARTYLVQSHEELVKLIAETERLAKESGWRAEVSLKPAQPAPPGLDRAQWHPAQVELTNLEGNGPERRAYLRLLDFMRAVKALGKKIELTHLNLTAGPEGLQSAQASLVIWSAFSHENAAAR